MQLQYCLNDFQNMKFKRVISGPESFARLTVLDLKSHLTYFFYISFRMESEEKDEKAVSPEVTAISISKVS